MIKRLKGTIIEKDERYIIIDVNGIGYQVFLSKKTIEKIPKLGEDITLFTFLHLTENNISLYGFLNSGELEFFETVKNIRGIGPRAALEIASLGPLGKIKEKILSQDENMFGDIPGIGRKKAMAIILELTGMIKDIPKRDKGQDSDADEAEEALVRLGFSRKKVKLALSQLPEGIVNAEEKVKVALKILGK